MAAIPEFNDESVGDDMTVVQAITEYRNEAEEARRDRLRLSARNRDAVAGRQDWSHKQEGQSTEHLPKSSGAVQQFKAFIKRGITQFGDWFEMEMPEESPLSGNETRAILKEYLSDLPVSLFNQESTDISVILSDMAEIGLVESLMILKTHGFKRKKPQFNFERGESTFKVEPWSLAVDLISPENYYPDPSGRGLYEVHRVERDLIDVIRLAEQGVYDKEVVDRIKVDFKRKEEEVMARKRDLDQDKTPPPPFRKRVVIDEFWGTIMDSENNILYENVVATVANDTYLIRKPQKNPFWHGASPFTAAPLTRVPFSVWHRALADDFVPLNEAQNELFNLMLDGGLASVWGIKQLHPDWLEDPRQASEGIPQGTTLVMNESAPPDGKVLEQIATGEVPNEAMAMFGVLAQEFNAAALTNEIKLGQLPSKQVKATEVVEASQSQAVVLDAIISDLETFIQKFLKKSWLTVLQNADDLEVKALDSAVGRRGALKLARMTKAERFNTLGDLTAFKVHGLSALLTRARDFQKLMGILQAVSGNPILLQSFHRQFSEDRIIQLMFKQMNLNPESMKRNQEEIDRMGQETQDASILEQLGLTGNGTQKGGEGGESGQSDINQEVNPTAGV